MMKMSKVREVTFKFLYHINMGLYSALDSSKEETVKNFSSKLINDFDGLYNEFCTSYGREDSEHPDNYLPADAKRLSEDFLKGIFTHLPEILEAISSQLNNRSLSKVEKIDLCCLIAGAFEIMYRETPKKVVINEVLSIGQKYGGQNTPAFLNGVLDKINKKS